jgi:hypothetical protein
MDPVDVSSQSGELSEATPRGQGRPATSSAEAEAAAILRDAEQRAAEILVRAERERESLLEQKMDELARDQALMAEQQKRLSELLDKALEEIERAPANGSPNVGWLQALRDKLRTAE